MAKPTEKKVPTGKDTTISVLQNIRELLIPMSNLARFQIQQINDHQAAQEAAKTATDNIAAGSTKFENN